MNNEQRIQEMHNRLTQAFSPTELNIVDDSAKHAGHAGAQSGAGHFTIHITSNAFKNKSMIECHRLVYATLADMIGPEIHAVQIKTKA